MQSFPPPRQRGVALHAGLIILLAISAALTAFLAFQSALGPGLAVLAVVSLATLAPIPALVYRLYALLRSDYQLDRETLRLWWGLRVEDIPLNDIEWVRPIQGLTAPINLPWPPLPGGLVGTLRHPDLGQVEFMAAEPEKLLFIATARHIYAISPEDPAGFVRAFQYAIEMGSLHEAEGHSQYPSFVVGQAWQSPLARALWVSGGLINIGIIIWVSALIPGLSQVSLGFNANGAPQPAVSGVQLLLIPMLSIGLFLVSWLVGLFFYRKPGLRPLAYSLWASGAFSTLLFLFGVVFLITARA